MSYIYCILANFTLTTQGDQLAPLIKMFENIKVLEFTRVLYDSVRNKIFFFEITAFLNYKRGTSRAGNSKSSENKTKKFLFSFDVLNFPALDFPRSICRKAGISK